MNREFKVGDTVIFVNDYFGIKKDTIGRVKSLSDSADSDAKYLVEVVDLNGKYLNEVYEYRLAHFELVSSTDKPISGKILTLPTDSEARKDVPVFSGCIKYFPAAIAGVSKISKAGNDKHNPGQELHHDRSKSLDHKDCILRHLMDTEDLIAALERGQIESTEQILAEVNALAWRALAYSQSLHEKYAGAPLAPGAKLKDTK